MGGRGSAGKSRSGGGGQITGSTSVSGQPYIEPTNALEAQINAKEQQIQDLQSKYNELMDQIGPLVSARNFKQLNINGGRMDQITKETVRLEKELAGMHRKLKYMQDL